MLSYFKRMAEPETGLGEYVAWFELDDGQVTRQVEFDNGHWRCSLDEYHLGIGPGLASQPFTEEELEGYSPIEGAEFEEAWEAAVVARNADR